MSTSKARRISRVIIVLGAAALCYAALSCRSPSTQAPNAGSARGAAASDSSGTSASAQEAGKVRPPARAGSFYPSDPETLKAVLAQSLDIPKPTVRGRIIGILVPHAGYQFCAAVAGYSYRAVQHMEPDTVVLIGPSHSMLFEGAALDTSDAWETPLGQVPVNVTLRKALLAADPVFGASAAAHAPEHSLEVQLPFLQSALGSATRHYPLRILPILIADDRPKAVDTIAGALSKVLKDEDVLLVASSDLSHYPSYEDAVRVDQEFLKAVASFDPAQVRATEERLMAEGVKQLDCVACGLGPLLVTMKVAKALGADKAEVLKSANSGDATDTALGPGVVGYGAVVFYASGESAANPPAHQEGAGPEGGEKGVSMTQPASDSPELNEQQQRTLLHIARQAIVAHIKGGPKLDTDAVTDEVLREQRAAFVTLKKEGNLRGCIGHIEPRLPLVEAVAELAVAAATQDFRFPPVQAEEVDKLEIDISAMSPLRKVGSAEEIIVGKHGVVVEQGGRRGVFLPQVAPEQGWDRETMLTVLCREKAGLPGDAWKKGADLYVFTAQVFSEQQLGIKP